MLPSCKMINFGAYFCKEHSKDCQEPAFCISAEAQFNQPKAAAEREISLWDFTVEILHFELQHVNLNFYPNTLKPSIYMFNKIKLPTSVDTDTIE